MKKILVFTIICLIQLITNSDSFAQIPGGMDGAKMPALDAAYAATVKGEVLIFLTQQKLNSPDIVVNSFAPNILTKSLSLNIVKTGFKVPVNGFFGKIEAYVGNINGKLNIVIPSNNSSGGVDYFSWGVSQ